MLQNNAFCGLFFLIGIAVNSYVLAIAALGGSIVGSLFALLMKFSKDDISNGLYGFNACLCGIAVFVFFDGHWILKSLLLLLFSIVSCLVMFAMTRIKLKPFTFPFVLSIWLGLIILPHFGIELSTESETNRANQIDWMAAVSNGVGQVFFQMNKWTGLLFLIGLAFSSLSKTAYALAASIIGILIAYLFDQPYEPINVGMFGFNAVLCSLVIFQKSVLANIYYSLAAIALSVIIVILIEKSSLIGLTFPFVLSTWMVLIIKSLIEGKASKTAL